MFLTVEQPSPEPYYARIASALRKAIAEGGLAPGERLPTAKELAAALDVNVHTVLRAYAMLRDDGLLDVGRGRGVHVTRNGTLGRARLTELAAGLAAEARRWGLCPDEAAELVKAAMT